MRRKGPPAWWREKHAVTVRTQPLHQARYEAVKGAVRREAVADVAADGRTEYERGREAGMREAMERVRAVMTP